MRFSAFSLRLSGLAAVAVTGCGVLTAQEAVDTVPPLPALKEEAAPLLPPSADHGETAPAPAGRAPAKPEVPATPEQRLVAVGEALAAANNELEALREEHSQLKLQMEALGIAAVKGDERSLQQRMLKAASDLHASEKARTKAIDRSNRLAEAAAAFMARPAEPALKTALEDAIKAATGIRTKKAAEAVSLDAARIVSYKAELGLAVVNAGRDSGIRMGTPLQVQIGRAHV